MWETCLQYLPKGIETQVIIGCFVAATIAGLVSRDKKLLCIFGVFWAVTLGGARLATAIGQPSLMLGVLALALVAVAQVKHDVTELICVIFLPRMVIILLGVLWVVPNGAMWIINNYLFLLQVLILGASAHHGTARRINRIAQPVTRVFGGILHSLKVRKGPLAARQAGRG